MYTRRTIASIFSIPKLVLLAITGLSSFYASADQQVVEPIIKTTWSQSGGYNPNFTYNAKTPLVGTTASSRAPVGCIAVAFGQVLKHFNYPNKGIGSNSYCNSGGSLFSCADPVEAEFYLTQYQWDEMPNTLNSLSSPENIDAVSELLFHIGASVNVKYGEQGSAAKLANPAIIRNFRKHFDMPAVETEYRNNFTEEAWYELITSEIRAGRPVVFVGFNTSVDAGHAYILDGINEQGQVHVNWGWGGYLNGYFDLESLVTPHGSFTEELFALVNFTPNVNVEGMSCNGPRGARCEDGLSCVSNTDNSVITDFLDNDDYGICLTKANNIVPVEVESVVTSHTKNIEQGAWYHVGVFDTIEDITVTMTGNGDADLYVRKGQQPNTSRDGFDCRPYSSTSNENCRLEGEGTYYVSVRGYDASEIQVTVETKQVVNEAN